MSEEWARRYEFQTEVIDRLARIETNQKNFETTFGMALRDLSARVATLEQTRVVRPRWFQITLGSGAFTALGFTLKVLIDIFKR